MRYLHSMEYKLVFLGMFVNQVFSIMNSIEQKQQRIVIQLGIVQQLMGTRMQQLIKPLGVSSSEFALLNHFSHQPTRSWTISELAKVMEMNQPGITKVVANLIEKGALVATQDKTDKRKRHLTITGQGLQLGRDSMARLAPDIGACFADWQEQELDQLLATSAKLMEWLDNHRLPTK